jgi:hypothetical protein
MSAGRGGSDGGVEETGGGGRGGRSSTGAIGSEDNAAPLDDGMDVSLDCFPWVFEFAGEPDFGIAVGAA